MKASALLKGFIYLMREIATDRFVWVSDTPQKVGKCVADNGNTVIVEWFYSPLHREHESLRRELVDIYNPPPNLRCIFYDQDADLWMAGRILLANDVQLLIRFPNGVDAMKPLASVWLRCFNAGVEPMALMAQKVWETPFFHTKRLPLVQELVAQEAATHGMSALLSAQVKLYDHQIDVIRRVLEDPMQRYLLADEVGLGKTVEAAVILRQTLLDEPNARVLVLIPTPLRMQWQAELRDRTQIAAPNYTIYLATHDDLCTPKMAHALSEQSWDFVIIDEAHHVARYVSDPIQSSAWDVIRDICHATPRVLLLSATPALHNEDDFCAMLHLLEPATYPLEDREAFRRKVAGREEVGIALDLLLEDMTTPVELSDAADALRTNLAANDAWVACKANEFDALKGRLRADRKSVSAQEITELVRETRLHLCETHRVHRRMLRSSRQRIKSGIVPNRDLKRFRNEWLCGDRCDAVQDGLDAWRDAATYSGATGDDVLRVFQVFLNLASTWTPLLCEAIRLRLHEQTVPDLVPLADAHLLYTVEQFPDEDSYLRNWLQDLERAGDSAPEGDDALHHLDDLLSKYRTGRTIIFTAYTSVAHAIHNRLVQRISARHLHMHTTDLDILARQISLDRFQNEEGSSLLICDRSGEEGLNLQFADRVIFFDMPWLPNRLEQRIGRVDRIGAGAQIMPIYLLLQEAQSRTSFSDAFYTVMQSGVGIFSTSIADLQFYFEKALPQWVQTAFRDGAEALAEQAASIQLAVQNERHSLRQQVALDTLEAYSVDDINFAETVRDADRDERQDDFKKALGVWLDALEVGYSWQRDRFFYREKTMLPEPIWDAIDAHLPQEHGMAFRRDDAGRGSNRDLMRIGHPFVDALAAYTQWEDRGRSWAMWRTLLPTDLSAAESDTLFSMEEPLAYFRFDLICETDYERLDAATVRLRPVERNALRRRATGWFEPTFHTVFVDAQTGQCVTDAVITSILLREYTYADRNLAKTDRREVVPSVLPDYEEVLDRAWNIARQEVVNDASTQRRQKNAERKAEKAEKTRAYHERRGINAEEKSSHYVLISAIREPLVRIDSVGLIILSRTSMPATPQGDE